MDISGRRQLLFVVAILAGFVLVTIEQKIMKIILLSPLIILFHKAVKHSFPQFEEGVPAPAVNVCNTMEYLKDEVRSVTTHQIIVYSTGLTIFLFHFWILWEFSPHYVSKDVITVIMDPFRTLLHNPLEGLLHTRRIQINSFTGNPFFLLPLFFLLGASPDALRAITIGLMAGAIMMFYFTYREMFGWKKSLLGILILASMGNWVFFRWPEDSIYTIAFFSILLFLYAKWLNTEDGSGRMYPYIISFLGGMFFYFKATTLYMLISLLAGAIYSRGFKVVRDHSIWLIITFFVAGALPFFLHSAAHPVALKYDSPQMGGPDSRSIPQTVSIRLKQIDGFLASYIEKSLGRTHLSPDTGEMLTGGTPPHMFSLLLWASIPLLIALDRHAHIPAIFTAFFTFLLFVPSDSGLARRHVTVLIPLVPLLIVAALDTLPERFENTQLYRAGFWAALLVAAFIVGSTTLQISSMSESANGEMPLHLSGGEQDTYRWLEHLNITEPIATNSYRVFVNSKYLFDVPHTRLLVPSGQIWERILELEDDLEGKDQSDAIWPPGINHYWAPVDRPNSVRDSRYMDLDRPTTVIVREDLPCIPREQACGASANETLQELDLSRDEMEQVFLQNESYLVARSVNLK